tara:strand:- start:4628 stop:5716 length:1089 start_codon:yes stop_codon:yes gene_type:complete
MHSPYTPDLDAPNMANPFEAETFRGSGWFKPGVKLSLKGLGPRFGTALKNRLKPLLKKLFKSNRAIKKTLKGLSDETIEKALKKPDAATDALSIIVARDINIISGTTKRDAMSAWLKKLPAKQDDLVINNGKWIAPDGTEYTKEFVDIFYKADGVKRRPEFARPLEIGEGGIDDAGFPKSVLKGAGATSEMDDALKGLADGSKFPNNPVKKSMDDLVSDTGKLSDDAIDEITNKALKSDDFIRALDDVSPTSLRNQPVDDIAKRALGTKSKFGFGIAVIVAGAWITNNILTDFASQLWGDSCTREYFENAFPDASPEELDAKVEACLDQAAKNIMYLGAAAVGLGGLLALFVLSRIIRKKSR